MSLRRVVALAAAACLPLGLHLMELAQSVRAGVEGVEMAAKAFIAKHESDIKPLEKAVAVAWWNANVTGKDEDFKIKEEAQNRYDLAVSDTARFAELKAIHDQIGPFALTSPPAQGTTAELKLPAVKTKKGEELNSVTARQIQLLYLTYLEKQVDPELLKKMTAKANAIEKAFNVYRAKVDGKEMTDSEVRKVLKQSKDSERRKAVWEASKGVGGIVEADLKELVKLRNESATKLGFKNFHAMMLHLNEQSQEQVLKLFDELDALTRGPFEQAKAEIDVKLAADSGVKVADLRPWHYQDPFFQESPAIFKADLDGVYAKADILQLCREFYAGIGLPIEDVIARSDLYEKPGKSPHAFCTDIDREGDVRVLANIVPNEYWMGTMLHELGHAVYSSKNIRQSVPYVLRDAAHILTTEGVAMMFEKFSKNADWLEQMGVKVADPQAFNETGRKMRRNQLLIFSRWCQVMLRFEKAMYENPDQDLNKLWWDLVEKYQQVKRPEGRSAPDYASKIHVVSAPAYYHNYMMGELFASQVHHTIARELLKTTPEKALYNGDKRIGEFMRNRVFGPGRVLPWNELTKFATGSGLNAKAFAADFGK